MRRGFQISSAGRIAVLVLLALGLTDVPTAVGQGEAGRGLYTVDPDRRELQAKPPVELGTSSLSNTTRKPLSVRVFPAVLGQQRDGAFTVLEAPQDLELAERVLEVAPRRFELGPGETRQVASRWTRLVGNSDAAYLTLVFEGVPPEPDATGIRTVVRLAQPNLLRLPGVVAGDGSLSGLRVEPAPGQELIFFPRVRNDSEVDGSPRDTRLRIENDAGKVVFDQGWAPGPPVLPGSEVEYPVTLEKVLPAGAYTATASMSFESSTKRDVRTLDFTLTGPNELPVTKFDLRTIEASGEVGESATVRVALRNTGTASGPAELQAELFAGSGGGDPIATEDEETEDVQPGETITAEVELGELTDLDHRVEVVVRAEGTEFDHLSATFTPTPERGTTEELGDFVEDHLIWIIIGLVVLIVAAIVAWRYRRLQDRLAYAEWMRRNDDSQ